MPYDIGARVGIDGESQFRAQIARINKDYKSMGSYLQALDNVMAKNGKSMEALSAKSNGLRQMLAMQEQKYRELSDALEKVRADYDAGSQEVLRFEGALLDVDNTIRELSKQLSDTEEEMDRLANGIEDVADAAGDADGKVLSFGDMLKAGIASGAILDTVEKIGESLLDLGSSAVRASADVKAESAQFEQTFQGLESTARQALDGVSDATGIVSTRIQGAYTALYAFTRSIGGDSSTALGIAERAMRAAADSAAYYDRTVEDASETLQSFLKGNYENDAALGIAATETTRNAKANELYAKSFKELSEAQKVDVLLSMVEAGNAASGALGAAAREAGEWTNVTGELSEAWRQLLAVIGAPVLSGMTPIIQGITDALAGLTKQTSYQALNEGLEGFQAGIAAADAELQKSTASMAATAGIAQQYLDRLHALETAGLTTAESQREYAQTVELLNALMPQLGLTINANTGLLDQNTAAIQTNIANLKKQAQQQAQQAYYKKIIDQYAAAYEAQYSAQQRLIELQAQEQRLLEQGADATIEYTNALMDATSAMPQMSRELSELDLQLIQNQAEQRNLASAIEESGAVLAEQERILETAQQGYNGLAESQQEAADAVGAQTAAQSELESAYAETLKAARESIDSQLGLFDKMASKSSMSRREILSNWEAQQAALVNYSANLQKAVDMGLDEALVRQLSDGSEQSMLILAELVKGSEANIAEVNAAFRNLGEAKDIAAEAMVDVENVVGASFDRMEADAKASGRDIVVGAADSILRNIPRYESAFETLANRGQSKYNQVWDRHSPSRWMRAASNDIVDGGVDQIQDRVRDMEDAMAQLGRSGQMAYQRQLAEYADSYPAVTAGGAGYTSNTIHNSRNVSLGGVTVVVNASPGQDSTALAYEVANVLSTLYDQEVNGFG